MSESQFKAFHSIDWLGFFILFLKTVCVTANVHQESKSVRGSDEGGEKEAVQAKKSVPSFLHE